jgi:hypothetical protein
VTLRFLSLGHSPLSGKQAVDQCIALKRQLRSLLAPVDGAYTMLCPDPSGQRCEVRVAYDPSLPTAEAWAKRAVEVAPELWKSLAERRKTAEVG